MRDYTGVPKGRTPMSTLNGPLVSSHGEATYRILPGLLGFLRLYLRAKISTVILWGKGLPTQPLDQTGNCSFDLLATNICKGDKIRPRC